MERKAVGACFLSIDGRDKEEGGFTNQEELCSCKAFQFSGDFTLQKLLNEYRYFYNYLVLHFRRGKNNPKFRRLIPVKSLFLVYGRSICLAIM